MGQAPDFFVSYTSTDRAWAEWIAWQLEAEGYQVVLQAWDFGPGLDWAHEMQHAITTAERVMAVLSTAYLESAHGEAEWLAFYARDPSGERGLLLPIRVDEVEPPGLLKSRVYVDLVGRDASSALAALLAAARGARGKPTEAPEFPGDRWLSVSASEAPRFPGESPTVRNVKVDPKNANPLLPVSESSQLLEHFTAAVRSYCVAIPSWFPDRLGFSQVKQQVSVTPPQVRGASPREKERNLRISAPEERPREEQEGASTSMRVSLDAALRQYQRLVIVGDPGVGKSWALRGLALSLLPASEEPEPEDDAAPLPFVALAPKLDSILQGGHIDDLSYRQIADALVRSMPDAVASRLSDAERLDLAARIADGRSLAVFIDGYDEVRSDQPALARALPAIEAFCLNTNSLFALTTRPSNVPPRATTSLGWCTIEPFANREQSTFIHGWFAGDKALARRLTSWVRAHRLEVMRVPLMLSLFCSVVEQGGQPPSTEHELWERALLRLAAEQDRFGEISPVGEHTRLRLTVLEHVAESFIGEGLRETVPISEIEGRLRAHEDWVALAAQLRTTSVMEDLLNTGIVQKASTGMHTDLVFLHSALRDYLIARVLARTGSWHDKLSKTWRHPEWEPVIGYLGALLDDPSELVSQLTTLFDDDPLNIARLVAGRALSAIGEGQLPAYIGSRVRDEILVLLTSNDVWDRLRASTLLPVMNVDGTTDLLRGLLNASVPTQVIVAAIGALAGNLSEPVQGTLYSVVNSDWFTTAEREAAVNAIADTGTEEALTRITDISADVHLPPGVRVAAAIAAWRSFDVDQLTLDILSNGEEDPTVQRPLSERLAVESEKAEMLARFISDGVLSVPDGYSRAVLLAAAQRGEHIDRVHQAVLESLPGNPALERLLEMAQLAFSRLSADPLLATLLRFVQTQAPPRLRWTVAERIRSAGDRPAARLWAELIDGAQPGDAALMAEHLASETESAPPVLRALLEQSLADESFPPIVEHALRRRRDKALTRTQDAPTSAKPSQRATAISGGDQGLGGENVNSLEAALDADLPQLLRYGALRVLRTQIPAEGELRSQAAALTHQVAVASATDWIDAAPAVAPIVEARLLAAGDESDSLVELARLRAHWPGRGSEVTHSSKALDARLLDAGAEAAMSEGDLSSASMLALASLGASSIDDGQPSSTAISVFFASGQATGRGASTWRKIRAFLSTQRLESLEWIILASWLEAGYNLSGVGRRLQSLPGYIQVGNPEVTALLVATDVLAPTALDQIVSWSGCRRAYALLLAARNYASSDSARSALERASVALDARSTLLATAWPRVFLATPAQVGKPREHWTLVNVAAKRLMAGDPECAVEIYEAASSEDPFDPELRNNLGFCRLPGDTEAALADLEAAARLFGKPFGVNSANRMLAYFRLDRYDRVLELGEEFFLTGTPPGSAWLWEVDASAELRNDVDVMLYIIDLAERSAALAGRDDEAQKWRNRRLAWKPEGGQ